MKKLCLTTLIILVLGISQNNLFAQINETPLDQVELLNQKLGSWKCELGGDTILYEELKPCHEGIESNFRYSINGKVFKSGKKLYGLDKVSNKILCTGLTEGTGCEIHKIWFTTKTNFYISPIDPCDPNKKCWKIVGHIVTPDKHTLTTIVDRRPVKKLTLTRLK